jgi:hypothetical protein
VCFNQSPTDGFWLQLNLWKAYIVVPITEEVHIKSKKIFLYVLREGLEQNLAGVWSNFEKRVKLKCRFLEIYEHLGENNTFGVILQIWPQNDSPEHFKTDGTQINYQMFTNLQKPAF